MELDIPHNFRYFFQYNPDFKVVPDDFYVKEFSRYSVVDFGVFIPTICDFLFQIIFNSSDCHNIFPPFSLFANPSIAAGC